MYLYSVKKPKLSAQNWIKINTKFNEISLDIAVHYIWEDKSVTYVTKQNNILPT